MPILSNFPGGAGSGSGGLTLAAVSGITTQVSSGKVYVKWTDPDDLVVAGSTIAAWGGTLLVRKAGSMPKSRRDGTQVLDSKTRDAYKNTYFCDSGLSNGTTYYYKFFPYTTANAFTDSTDNEFNATPTVQVAGITSWNVTGMSASAEAGNGKMTVKWTDPAASITADGVTLATWASTTIVVKSGSYPTSKDDSNAVYTLKVTTRNQYSSTPLTITGLTNGTKYYIAFFPETTDGGINTSTSQRTTGTANRITIANVPSQSGTLTYNASSQSPSWSNYNTTYMTLGGTTSGTTAGSYTASFTPKTDYRWSDGTTTAKNVTWSIGKATGTLTVSKTSITLNSSARSSTFTIGGNYDGTLSVVSSATGIATVSRSGTTVTVSSVNDTTGTATVTVSCTAGTNYTAPANKTVAITASFKPTASTTATSGVTYTDGLSGVSDSDLSLFGEAISNNSAITNTTSTVYIDFGSVHRKLVVGDAKTWSMNGTDYEYKIMGFNHYDNASSTAYGATTATGKAGILFQMTNCFATKYAMKSSMTSGDGWDDSDLRTTMNGTLFGYLPTSTQNVIREVSIKTAQDVSTATIITTSDKLFLPAEVEVFGTTSYAKGGTSEGTQYAYYKAGNSKVKTVSGSASDWWERSPYYWHSNGSSSYFCIVGSSGATSYYNAAYSYGVAPCFCI